MNKINPPNNNHGPSFVFLSGSLTQREYGYRRHTFISNFPRGERQKTCSPAHGREESGGGEAGQGNDGAAQQRDRGTAEEHLGPEAHF